MRRDETSTSNKHYILGLDGGGTKTHAVLFALDDIDCSSPLKTALAGPCNLNSTTEADVRAHFQTILSELDVLVSNIVATGLGAAGISGPGVQDKLHAILSGLNLHNLCIVGDQVAALRGALGPDPGILLIAGTGSIAIGQGSGDTARAGGFGHLVGDEGSGYALGKIFLAETLKAFDGQRAHSPLTQAITDRLSSNDPIAEIMGLFYSQPFDKSRVAQFAVVMDSLLEMGDAETLSIAECEATSLVSLVQAVTKKIKESELKLVLSGSLLKSEDYRAVFLDRLENTETEATYIITEAIADAACGAAMLARELI